jgi:hypothetical protein
LKGVSHKDPTELIHVCRTRLSVRGTMVLDLNTKEVREGDLRPSDYVHATISGVDDSDLLDFHDLGKTITNELLKFFRREPVDGFQVRAKKIEDRGRSRQQMDDFASDGFRRKTQRSLVDEVQNLHRVPMEFSARLTRPLQHASYVGETYIFDFAE